MDELKKTYRDWVEEALEKQGRERQALWTDSIAVGSEPFVRDTKEKLGIRALGRQVIGGDGSFELREPEPAYTTAFGLGNVDLGEENAYYWDVSD